MIDANGATSETDEYLDPEATLLGPLAVFIEEIHKLRASARHWRDRAKASEARCDELQRRLSEARCDDLQRRLNAALAEKANVAVARTAERPAFALPDDDSDTSRDERST